MARLQRGERVLIHGASGGVGLAAIAVARWLGAEIIATAGSEAKRALLRQLGVDRVAHSRDTSFHEDVMRWTEGRGVDVVLNFTPGDVMLRSLSCLARFGRFVEIGKAAFDQDMALPLRAFNEGLAFTAVDFDRMTRHKPAQVRAIAERVLAHLAAGDFAGTPVQHWTPAQVGEAFRTLARGEHVGKVAIDLRPESNPDGWPVRMAPPALLDPSASYLVTGGLDGFGLEVTRELVARGARHLVLLSRRGGATPGAAERLAEWARQGVAVCAAAVDVSDRAALARVFEQLAEDMPPLKGVVHAAAVLDDRPIDALDEDALQRVFAAKAQGAWHLHELTQDCALDFFVLFSSISAVIGNAGQAAYAGANNFLDQLAAHRRAQHLPALSVQWGVLGESGMVARNAGLGRYLAQQGVKPLRNAQALTALWSLLEQGAPAAPGVMVADVDWARMARAQQPGNGGQRLAAWREAGTEDGAAPGAGWISADPEASRGRVEAELARVIATVMKMDGADIRPTQPLRDMGMDSLMALELSLEVETAFGVKLPTMAVAGGPPLRDLAERILQELTARSTRPAAAPEGTTVPDARESTSPSAAMH